MFSVLYIYVVDVLIFAWSFTTFEKLLPRDNNAVCLLLTVHEQNICIDKTYILAGGKRVGLVGSSRTLFYFYHRKQMMECSGVHYIPW